LPDNVDEREVVARMAKKTDKVLKSLKKDVAKLRKQNDNLAEALEKTREDQAAANSDLRSLLEARLTTHDTAPGKQEDNSRDGGEGPAVTGAAQRRAKELGVDLSSVKGTGSGGRVLVKDVEAATDGG
jgi:pyruvate/2-oxoglutarate dehydrogenase complex dihydrolipoamide acyltransferase (E2) component